jgi:type II secretory pathway pseudopilin PulG
MGLIELLIAMVILNVGLFAVVGVFNGATVAMSRAATISAATAVADKQIEIYRSLSNCAIWLDADPADTVGGAAGMTAATATNTFPVKGSGSLYEADTSSYTNSFATSGPPNYTPAPAPVTFFDKSAGPNGMGILPWATSATTTAVSPSVPPSCTPSAPPPPGTVLTGAQLSDTSTPPWPAIRAVQQIAGPDGVKYWVYTYIIIVQANYGATLDGAFMKQVTVVVRDPVNQAKVLARQTSLFDPLMG